NIILHGFSNEIESALQEACLKIFTSKKEGFALSILESLSKGTPVISYDVDYGPNEMIENGKNGYLIEEGNEGEMAKVIISLLKDKKKLKKLSENCYTSIEKFSDKKTFFKWQRVINTIEQDEKI
ncbi:glycosyltransferase, partial [Staphylococcus haemolyticus]